MSSADTMHGNPFRLREGALSAPRLRRRVLNRRRTLALQAVSYALGTSVLGLYALAGTIPIWLPPVFLASGLAVIGMFLLLSETHVCDRFQDHFLTVPQVAAHVAVQYGFLILAPQVGYAFLAVVFLIFNTGALRMTSTQATIAWLLMTAATAAIFLLHAPIGMAMSTHGERVASLLAFVATIGQCIFVGLYGNAMRKRLYRSGVELRLAYSRIEELAELDELTGAHNRRSIMRALDDEIASSQRTGSPCAIALIDLDWFKRVNDLYGHPTGDEVLRTFAISIFANIRPAEKFGRYGGEEFLLIMPDTTKEDAIKITDRLRAIIADVDWSALSPGMSVTISAGVASLVGDDNADSLLARADRSLYAAKDNGRNRVESLA
jgi:diguanylate cyclase (GGDEF)-like protein